MTRKIEGSTNVPTFRARSRSFRTVLRPRHTAILLAALLAFVWQSVVTQTHEHFPLAGSALQNAKVGACPQAISGRPSRDDPANCPICREIAHAGAYLTPAPPTIPFAAETVAPTHEIIPSLSLTLSARSHAWRSRAPPILQA